MMADDVAQKLESDIILPKSSVKPEYRGSLVRSVRSVLGDRQPQQMRKKSTSVLSYSAFASSSRCFSNWAVHVATGPRTVPNASPVS